MSLLLVGLFCGIFALAAAVVIQFRLPLWMTVAGIAHLEAERRTHVNVQTLRRLVSFVYYVLAFTLFSLALALYLHLISESVMIFVVFGVLFVVVNSLYLIRRRCDRNTYSESHRQIRRILLLALNFVLAVLVLVSALCMV